MSWWCSWLRSKSRNMQSKSLDKSILALKMGWSSMKFNEMWWSHGDHVDRAKITSSMSRSPLVTSTLHGGQTPPVTALFHLSQVDGSGQPQIWWENITQWLKVGCKWRWWQAQQQPQVVVLWQFREFSDVFFDLMPFSDFTHILFLLIQFWFERPTPTTSPFLPLWSICL